MGFYAKFVLPKLIDLAMRNKEVAKLRAAWIPQTRGEVLEIGIGSGLNLPHYSSAVQRVRGVDPSAELQVPARQRASTATSPVEFISQRADEPLPLRDECIDTVVVTWTLCSIPDPSKALQEMRRVLKKDGRLVFIEHGRAPVPSVGAWQDRLTPIWKRIGGGCHLNRKIDDLLASTGFRVIELKNFYLTGPRPMTYTYQGLACPE